MECGLPVVETPPSALTVMPSLTMALVPPARDGEIWTAKCTCTWPPAGMVRSVHRMPAGRSRPPWSADWKVVLGGSGSVMLTPVAGALPMFFTVIV